MIFLVYNWIIAAIWKKRRALPNLVDTILTPSSMLSSSLQTRRKRLENLTDAYLIITHQGSFSIVTSSEVISQ